MLGRARHVALLCLLAGCSFEPPYIGPPGVSGTLVPSSGAMLAHLGGVAEGLVVRTGQVMRLDTDTGEITLDGDRQIRPGGEQVVAGVGFYVVSDEVAVLAVSSLTIEPDATLRPQGSRAIVLLSEGGVSIDGIVDASAPCDDATPWCAGPGGGDGAATQNVVAGGCAPGKNGVGSLSTVGRTGGGGGGLGTDGAAGGQAGAGALPGGEGGSPTSEDCPDASAGSLIGGGGGGAGAPLDSGGDGGGGGGAVQITSLTSIVLDPPAGAIAGIFASGGGGGGASDGGGGGGGSGGMILLEAPAIQIGSAYLIANGGGGGAGGLPSAPSYAGEDGQLDGQAAAGGEGQFPGGAGGALASLPEDGVGGGDSTGGGGGSVGIILLRTPANALETHGATFSPQAIRTDLAR